MFVIIKMLPFRVAPYLSLLLVLCGSALAQETEQPPTGLPPVFDIDFESTDAQLTGCPPDKVSFELVTGYVYSAPADMLDSQPGTLMLTDCIDMCRKNRSCMAVNYETGLCVLFSSNADMYPVLEEIMSWFYKIKDLFLCSLYSFYAYTRPHAHYTPTSSAMSVTGPPPKPYFSEKTIQIYNIQHTEFSIHRSAFSPQHTTSAYNLQKLAFSIRPSLNRTQ
nr:uncharacterized protein LOC113817859 [Penaeus vannamei]